MKRAPILAAGRAISALGDVGLRVTLAAAACSASRTNWLVGMVLISPVIGGLATRGRFPSLVRWFGFRRLAGFIEVVRAVLFTVAAFHPAWATIIPILLLAGSLQPLFEGAIGGLLSERVAAEQMRRDVNAMLRVAFVAGSVGGALLAAAIHLTPAAAALWDALTFVASAASLVFIGDGRRHTLLTQTAPATAPLVPTGKLVQAYLILAGGLAVAAPSMPRIAHALFAASGTAARGYGGYQALVALGMFAGADVWRRLRPATARALLTLIILESALAFSAVATPVVFGLLVLASALAENMLVLEILARLQSEYSSAAGAQMAVRLRTHLAIVSVLGFVVNLALDGYSQVMVLAVASAAGGVAALAALSVRPNLPGARWAMRQSMRSDLSPRSPVPAEKYNRRAFVEPGR